MEALYLSGGARLAIYPLADALFSNFYPGWRNCAMKPKITTDVKPEEIIEKMLSDKEKIEKYFHSGDKKDLGNVNLVPPKGSYDLKQDDHE